MQNFDAPSLANSNQVFSNRYRLQQFLGKGTFGQVYAAEDTKFSPPKRVAIKIINSEFINDPVVREDVRREAGVMARFNHPYILRVLDFEVNPTSAYIVTDLAEGGSLSSRIQPDPTQPPVQVPLVDVANLLDQIGSALDLAHGQGLIHRDIKPQNILIDNWGRPLLADFGLATSLNGSQKSVMVMASTSGTPSYMAPEQWTGQAGRASDIYALGVLTYQLITGKTPFQGNHFELMGQHLNKAVPPLWANAPGLNYPPQLDQLLAEAMAKNPHNRIKSAMELARRFKAALQNSSGQGQEPVPASIPATEIAGQVKLPPQVSPFAPYQPDQVVDPLRAETEVVGLAPLQNLPNNTGGATPNYNQSGYGQQPPLNHNYNGVYASKDAVFNANSATPRKMINTLLIIGGGLALLLVLIVILAAVSSPRPVSSRTSLSLYPNAAPFNVLDSYKQSRIIEYNRVFGKQQRAHDAQYFASSDSREQIAQFFLRDAQSKGSIVRDLILNDGLTREIQFKDAQTNDLVVVNIMPPQAALPNGIQTGSKNLIEIID